jgi:hypothetical protein
MLIRLLAVGVLLVCVLFTAGIAVGQVAYGQPFQLGVGQSTEVGDAGLVIGFDAVPLESRCPSSVVCVWEGVAEVSLWVEPVPGSRIPFSLYTTTNGEFVREVEIAGHRVALVVLDPYPVLPGGADIDPDQYVATISVIPLGSVGSGDGTCGQIKGRYR